MKGWVVSIGAALPNGAEVGFAPELWNADSDQQKCSNQSHGSANECPFLYQCSICLDIVESLQRGEDDVCHKYHSCAFLNSSTVGDTAELPARLLCEQYGFCDVVASSSGPTASPLNLRISKALGSRGYNYVRVSVISHAHVKDVLLSTTDDASAVSWSYQSQFKQRWYQFYLQSAVVPVVPGSTTTLNVNGHQVDVKIPSPSQGSVGLLVADPCVIQSSYCVYEQAFDIKNVLQSVLNSLSEYDLDYWMNVGDLFYDRDGGITESFFGGLSLTTMSKRSAMLASLASPTLTGGTSCRVILRKPARGWLRRSPNL
mmetsp:Transcript_57268/g.153033  ORF Transcript_57268/g.153033 Transcript_57268/m.153033 type:complete len:315 (+) Transcript_57268:29-973(+)